MAKYRTIERLQTADGVIHEVGEVLTLDDQEAQVALRLKAVEVVPNVVNQDEQQLNQLKQEESVLEQKIAQEGNEAQ